MFLEAMWKRFGGEAAERLTQLARGHPAYRRALEAGDDSEIAFDAQGQGTVAPRPAAGTVSAAAGAPMTHSGKRLTKWIPGQKRQSAKSASTETDPFANDPGNPVAKFNPRRPA